ncbi:MAG: hypothetical protein K9M84_11765 [Spirochaetia bacterium]|nr:hypothetical protein [Spirochaetia bacterium]
MKKIPDLWIHRVMRIAFVLLCVRLFAHAGAALGALLQLEAGTLASESLRLGLQLVLTIGVMLLLSRSLSLRDIGFNLNHWKWNLKYALLFFVLTVALSAAMILLIPISWIPDTTDVLISWTLKGLSDELLYRAFIIGMLLPIFPASGLILGKRLSIAGVISIVLFALAPLSISLYPFTISYVGPLEQAALLGLGLVTSLMFEYTHSLLGPVLVHSFGYGIFLTLLLILNSPGA